MKCRRSQTFASAAVASMVLLSAGEASPRTVHASAGTSVFPSDRPAFSVHGNGVTWTSTGSSWGMWIIPVVIDNAGAKTVTVRAKINTGPGAGLGCKALAFGTNGAVTSSSGDVFFPVTGSYTSISLSLVSVQAGGFAEVACTFGGSPAAHLLGIDYLP